MADYPTVEQTMLDLARFGFTWSMEWAGSGWIVKATDRSTDNVVSRYAANLHEAVKAVKDTIFKTEGQALTDRLSGER